jgi:hypothetical protein
MNHFSHSSPVFSSENLHHHQQHHVQWCALPLQQTPSPAQRWYRSPHIWTRNSSGVVHAHPPITLQTQLIRSLMSVSLTSESIVS